MNKSSLLVLGFFSLVVSACSSFGSDDVLGQNQGEVTLDVRCAADADCPAGYECEIEEEHGVTTSFCKAHRGATSSTSSSSSSSSSSSGATSSSSSSSSSSGAPAGQTAAGGTCTTNADCAVGLECEVELEYNGPISTCEPHGGGHGGGHGGKDD